MKKLGKGTILILHDIRSVINTGSIFRTAEAFGVERIILSGYTPGPIDRFGRIRQDFHKAALGAESLVPFSHVSAPDDVLREIQSEERRLVVLEQDPRAVDIRSLSTDLISRPLALVVGNETEGVAEKFLDSADVIVEIPMLGQKESLNVSSATAVALFALLLHS